MLRRPNPLNHDHPKAERKGLFGRLLQTGVRRHLNIPPRRRDGGEHHGNRIAVRYDRQTSDPHACNKSVCCGVVWHPHRRRNLEVDHPRYDRYGLVGQLHNSQAPHLQQARKGRGWPRNQPAMSGLDMNPVIGHQPRKDQLTA